MLQDRKWGWIVGLLYSLQNGWAIINTDENMEIIYKYAYQYYCVPHCFSTSSITIKCPLGERKNEWLMKIEWDKGPLCVCVCMCICICSVCLFVCVCLCKMWVYECVCVHMCVCVFVCACMHAYMCARACVNGHVCVWVLTCRYTYIIYVHACMCALNKVVWMCFSILAYL